MIRRIFFLTGARSDYDLMSPVIQALAEFPQVEASVIAAASQMSPFHGLGVEQMRKEAVRLAGCVESLMGSESWEGRALSFSNLSEGLTRLLASNRPDILFVAGDREEALAAAIVANFLGIPLAHLHGGDRCIASEIDEVLRPAISKLAHLHFTASATHRQRVIAMGEREEYVWACGAPTLDRLRAEPDLGNDVLSGEVGIDVTRPFFFVIQHPSPLMSSGNDEGEMTQLLEGVLSLGHPVLCSYPNSDPGNVGIRRAIDRAKAENSLLSVHHNLPRPIFIALYRRCAAIVGNSSSLVIESGFLQIPAILVGPRQDLRDRGDNVIRVDLIREEVSAACRQALEDRDFRERVRNSVSPYGDGHAAPRIAHILAEIALPRELLLKTITY